MKETDITWEDARDIVRIANAIKGSTSGTDNEIYNAVIRRFFEEKRRRGTILVSSRAFRARLSEFSKLAEGGDVVYITRPGGSLLCLSRVSEDDVKLILKNTEVDKLMKAEE